MEIKIYVSACDIFNKNPPNTIRSFSTKDALADYKWIKDSGKNKVITITCNSKQISYNELKIMDLLEV